VHGRPLVWLDNGATTQKPEAVIGHEGTVRASLALYDTREDIDALIAALRQIATRTIELPRGTDHRFNTATP
jgi:selenocysteine lyase/cysteine desulfurase